MQPRKLTLGINTYCYGGNGSTRSSCPDVHEWLLQVVPKIKDDPRIEQVFFKDFSDTPITMTRNAAVLWNRSMGCDLQLMIDSDMLPDPYRRETWARPFWDSSFNYLYEHYDKGPVFVMAPYGGPPPTELTYIFYWKSMQSAHPDDKDFELAMYTREHAASLTGIAEIAAGPTGLGLIDTRLYDLMEPGDEDEFSWFYYEWDDKYQASKSSTEDVTFTRDASFFGIHALGYNPMKCNWDAWAGHWKPKCVAKPQFLNASNVGSRYTNAIKRFKAMEGLQQIRSKILDNPPEKDGQEREAAKEFGRFGSNRFGKFKHLADRKSATIVESLKNQNATIQSRAVLIETVLAARPDDRPMRCAELGSYIGESARFILETAGPESTLVCVDTFNGSPDPNDLAAQAIRLVSPDEMRGAFEYNTRDLKDRITLIQADSQETAGQFEDGSFDLVYIDADHTYRGVKRDIEAWRSKVRPGGILCGHDYGAPNYEGVKRAVDEAFPHATIKGDMWSVFIESPAPKNGHAPHNRAPQKRKKVKVG